mgnify:CR=1 FL=1
MTLPRAAMPFTLLLCLAMLAACSTNTSLRPGYDSVEELTPMEQEAYLHMRSYSDCVFEDFRSSLENQEQSGFPLSPILAFASCANELQQFMAFLMGLSQDQRWVERQMRLFQEDVFNALRQRFLNELEENRH